jgi:hypothetical protein
MMQIGQLGVLVPFLLGVPEVRGTPVYQAGTVSRTCSTTPEYVRCAYCTSTAKLDVILHSS